MKNQKPKLITVLGPTATGKTALGVFLARLFAGEIVSADSRQVYKGMDLGTGKDLAEYGSGTNKVPYHMIDIVKPMTEYNVGKYKKKADKIICDISTRGKVPFLVGGTGLWLSAVVDNYQISTTKPDPILRKKIAQMSDSEKLKQIKKLNPETFQNIDQKNPRRLERALEVILSGDKFSKIKNKPKFETLQLGLTFPREEINKRIDQRVDTRMKQGMLGEVAELHKQGVSWPRMESFGLEYRFLSRHLRGLYTLDEATEKLKIATHQFAKRQMTWFRRNKKINWIENKKQAQGLIREFLEK
jgi:tRNA dimethylallyltransferase